MTETIYQNLVVDTGMNLPHEDSIHLCNYPVADAALIDKALEKEIAVMRQVVGMGRALRESHKLKVRQPLAAVTVVTHDVEAQAAVRLHAELIASELNVKEVRVLTDDDALATISIKPNFKTLGPRAGRRMKEVADGVSKLGREQFALLQDGQSIIIADVAVVLSDVQVTREARGDVVIETEGHLTVALDTVLGDVLVAEGLAREIVSRLQKLRKDKGFAVTDRIILSLTSDAPEIMKAIETHQDYIAQEVLATTLNVGVNTSFSDELDLDGRLLHVSLEVA